MKRTTLHKAVFLPFMACVGFLRLLGKCLGLSYKQISIFFNLYLQGGLLAASGASPLVETAWTTMEHNAGA